MVTYEAAAAISDPAGNLLFYTNCVNVWNRNHQLMPNGQNLGGHESATQGALIVRNPANASQYYLFVVDGCDNYLVGGLKYSLVDMTQQGGLGGVTARATQLSTVQVTEKLTAVRHANGKDTWIVVHGWNTNTFYAYLLTASGISSTPVTTSIGAVHSGGGGNTDNANGVGYMKASAAGNKLALAIRDGNFELFDFNNATGMLSNYVPLPQNFRSYGVEFSPDGSRLYGSTLNGNRIYQFNVLAGSATEIAASATLVGTSTPASAYIGALQLASDGKIYAALYNSLTLGVINNPNSLGTDCNYSNSGPALGGRLSQLGLPNFPNAFAPLANEWTGAVSTVYTDAANWSAGFVPGSTDDVTIKATATRMPVLSTSASVHSFTVDAGASMTVDGTFTVTGSIRNDGSFSGAGEVQMTTTGTHTIDGTRVPSIRNLTLATGATTQLNVATFVTGMLTLNANLNTPRAAVVLASSANGTAMVVNNGNFAVVGRAVVQRYIAPGLNPGLGYRHYSSPVSNVSFDSFIYQGYSAVVNPAYNSAAYPGTVTPFPTVYGYDQQRLVTAASPGNSGFNAGWYSPSAATNTMGVGVGYTFNIAPGKLLEFDGPLNNGPISRSNLARNEEADGGWHLLGNPYPAPIDWRQTFTGATNLLNSVYVFKSSGQYDGSYVSYVNGVGEARYIASGQAFFVRVAAPNLVGSLDFTNSARLTTYLSPDFSRPATTEARPLVQLDLVSGERHDAAYVYFEQGATAGFDAAYDAYKITAGEVAALSVQAGAEVLSISGLPNTLAAGQVTVPLSVYVPKAGNYALAATQLLNLPAGVTVYLRDAQTGALVNLQQQPEYAFSTGAPLYTTTRFTLVFSPQQVLASFTAQLSTQVALYPNPAQREVTVTLPALLRQPGSALSLVNALGQTVLRQAVPATGPDGTMRLALAGVAKGVYTLRISSPAGSASKKLVVE
ncbi:T9SS type A sorting domain-containing protein [Hymenobacter chitinivorans]|nr:T9SS type A sorting domain-containing protein [Hymenobacter chitinivorans]